MNEEQSVGPGDVGDLAKVLGKDDPLFAKPKVHQLGANIGAGPKGDQLSTECETCDGKGWVDAGATACPDCNAKPTCRCVTPKPNRGASHCLGCGQALGEEWLEEIRKR